MKSCRWWPAFWRNVSPLFLGLNFFSPEDKFDTVLQIFSNYLQVYAASQPGGHSDINFFDNFKSQNVSAVKQGETGNEEQKLFTKVVLKVRYKPA